jgi:hypothetical protein
LNNILNNLLIIIAMARPAAPVLPNVDAFLNIGGWPAVNALGAIDGANALPNINNLNNANPLTDAELGQIYAFLNKVKKVEKKYLTSENKYAQWRQLIASYREILDKINQNITIAPPIGLGDIAPGVPPNNGTFTLYIGRLRDALTREEDYINAFRDYVGLDGQAPHVDKTALENHITAALTAYHVDNVEIDYAAIKPDLVGIHDAWPNVIGIVNTLYNSIENGFNAIKAAYVTFTGYYNQWRAYAERSAGPPPVYGRHEGGFDMQKLALLFPCGLILLIILIILVILMIVVLVEVYKIPKVVK